MAYLTERASNQKPTAVTGNGGQSASVADQTYNPAEQNNLNISRQLKEKKNSVIGLLSHFPATALWLLDKYQQADDYSDIQDDEAALKSDLANNLNEIKKHYLLAAQTFTDNGVNSARYGDAKAKLSLALQEFPFAFEDLNKLVDVLAYAYQFKGFCPQPAQQPTKRLMIKRLENLQRPARTKPPALARFFAALTLNEADWQFLFLSGTQMQQYFAELVVAEQLWLKARQQLAMANNKLVLFIANQYKGAFLDFEDLVQEGQSGLLKAVDRFDYRLGFQFSTYAGYWIRQAISRSLSRSERVVRVPCGQVAIINKVYRAKEELLGKTGKEPSIKEIADYTSMSHNEINTILSISQTAISLESADDDENSFSPIDFLEQQIFSHAFNTIAESDLGQLLHKAIENLNPREAKVICNHFGLAGDRELTLQEIGTELNLTRERVRQIQVCALNKIKLDFGQELACFL